MTTILYKDGQFQTEDGISLEDQEYALRLVYGQHGHENGLPMNYYAWRDKYLTEGSTYSIREKVEVVEVDPHREYTGGPLIYRKVARIVEEKEEILFDRALSKVTQSVRDEVQKEFDDINRAFESMPRIDYKEESEEPRDLAFLVWYSGMTADKIKNAYKKYLRETRKQYNP